MACSNLVIWRAIPAGNRFGIFADGEDDNFNITVAVDCDAGSEAPWRHDEIIAAGGKTREVTQNDSCTFTVFITVLSVSGDPMCIDAWIEDANGQKTDKQCRWSFKDPGHFQIMINVDNQ